MSMIPRFIVTERNPDQSVTFRVYRIVASPEHHVDEGGEQA